MHETDTYLGTISVRGLVHNGALNCVIWMDTNPADWVIQQFVSQEELDAFAAAHKLRIRKESARKSTE